jgi:translation initiation factor 3 subunit G
MDDLGGPSASDAAPSGPSTGGKYVPPSMRAGASGAERAGVRGGGGGERGAELPTLRVTNISEDTQVRNIL